MTTHTSAPRRYRATALALASTAVLGATLTACGAASAAPTSARGPLAEFTQKTVDAGASGVIVRMDDGRHPATSIADQAGWTTADHRLTANDEFRMGSNTKTMIATLVLQLVAEHRLALTDPVEQRLPGLVPNGRAITVRMLLNHTSGLFNYLYDPAVLAAYTGRDTRRWTPVELLAAGTAHPPLFAPGSRFSYSNTNYIALGLILQRATGQSLADLIQQRIARPLHLRHTHLPSSPAVGRRLAHGYEPDAAHLALLLPAGTPPGTSFAGPHRGTADVDTTAVNQSTLWAAGGVVSTAADWARFDTALLSGKLLPAAQLAQMRTTVPEDPTAPNGDGYGLGLRKVVFPCGTVWGHDGQAAGYSSETYTDPKGKRTVAVLTSTVFDLARPRAAAAHQALVNAAVCAMLGKRLPTGSSPSPAAG
ncbi:D-alanyl-D-alanine carboxypeptidase [Streptomyces griseochromogenes]|uniref:D-alanyl-D-alanine carboxypeptidase n=1 Tax=Streptomyces griseochromogenes TaxID=68214 RepID=A0ABS4LRA4_9ACTN|nr:serine hydrolase domain-containing protein [Streptomyces griseochromogenes]MBP2049935.1 D-alanyl-D-alanine carboxypeptidase [Streptomyces griseochromogenes]